MHMPFAEFFSGQFFGLTPPPTTLPKNYIFARILN
jgi:hypothetical protein